MVEWQDSWAAPSTEMKHISELQEKGGEAIRMVEVGFLMRRDDDGVLLAATLVYNDDNDGIGRARQISFIQAADLVSVRKLA